MASEKVTAMIEEIKALTVLELAELVHELEDTFGVSAAAVAAPAAGAAAAAPAAETARERSKAAGPETPVSVNSSSPSLRPSSAPPQTRRRAQSALMPLSERG